MEGSEFFIREIFKLRLTDLLIGNEMVEGVSGTYTLDGRTSFMVYENPHPFMSKSLKLSLPLLPGTLIYLPILARGSLAWEQSSRRI